MRSRVQAPIFGPTAKNTKDNGSTTRCTEMVISGGPMAKSITAKKERSTAAAYTEMERGGNGKANG